jgi:Mce-associated membrane protein
MTDVPMTNIPATDEPAPDEPEATSSTGPGQAGDEREKQAQPSQQKGPQHSKARSAGPQTSPEGGMRRFGIAMIINVLVIAILAGALIFTLLRVRDQDSQNSLRSSAVKAATTYGVYLSSYDYKNLNGPGSAWAEVESHATDKFRQDFASTSANLAKLLNQYNATATGKVIAVGMSSVTGSRAVALLFIDQTVTNTVQKPNSVTQPLRVEITMRRQNGRWLIDALQVPK